MPIVCPHKLCKINLPTKKDTVPAVSFFDVLQEFGVIIFSQNTQMNRKNRFPFC